MAEEAMAEEAMAEEAMEEEAMVQDMVEVLQAGLIVAMEVAAEVASTQQRLWDMSVVEMASIDKRQPIGTWAGVRGSSGYFKCQQRPDQTTVFAGPFPFASCFSSCCPSCTTCSHQTRRSPPHCLPQRLHLQKLIAPLETQTLGASTKKAYCC